jgi:hypothetical protein
MSPHEFRRYADECLKWAKTTQSDKDRRDFLRMAEAWIKAAALLERPRTVSERQPRGLGWGRPGWRAQSNRN